MTERLVNIYLLLIALFIIAVFLYEQVEDCLAEIPIPRVRVSVALLSSAIGEGSGHA